MPLPAQPLQLCSYLQNVGSTAGSKSAVEEAMNAVSWARTIKGLESPTRHPTVVSIMEAYRRVLAAPKNKKQPVTAEDLRKMVSFANDEQVWEHFKYTIIHFCMLFPCKS